MVLEEPQRVKIHKEREKQGHEFEKNPWMEAQVSRFPAGTAQLSKHWENWALGGIFPSRPLHESQSRFFHIIIT